MQQSVERGYVTIAVERMQDVQPTRRRAFERPSRQAQPGLEVATDVNLVGADVPVENHVPAAGHSERAPFGVGSPGAQGSAAGKGALHDREADQHDDQHEPADQAGRGEIVGDMPERRRPGRKDPDD